MKKKDKELIENFVKKAKKVPKLECIILFGSMVRDEADKRSDIDLLLVFDSGNPKSYLSEIISIITSLKPHREIKPTITNLTDYDEEFLQTVMREGKVLWGKVIVTTNNLLLKPYKLISYDLTSLRPSKKVKISRLIHGYESKKMINGNLKHYKYTGLRDKYDVIIISKNTLLLPDKYSKSFLNNLKKYHVSYEIRQVWL
jgi:predicted nucleotidyltransferase